ncbi:hypothetical protein [Falsirhodobacter halotolerans]|uniref:hypothetical protein n=1 Tax=Falsirhodobacter halotolerans TaxID=1146892 RepID=UPI001FD11C31|nr:hypothetical protein [Falsirhodobacter halotolerans]MCJ8139371.1 hypothetical protein [Falsirhodobacter halotolerans]
MNAPAFRLAASDEDLFDYPLSADDRLDSHHFIAFNYREYQGSDFRQLATPDVRGIALDLICEAQDQTPVGTLPTDERILASLVKVSLDVWRDLSARQVGPLSEWVRCRCDDGRIRLYNPSLLKVTLKAVTRRDQALENLASDRERKRLGDLPAKILRAGGTERMAQDQAFVMQVDQFLLDHYPNKNRTVTVMRTALEHLSMRRGVT